MCNDLFFFQFQYLELSPISKLKDRLAANQNSAKQIAFACVVIHVPLLTWTISRACGVEPQSMSGGSWRGSFWFASLLLQATTMAIFNGSGRKESAVQPSHQIADTDNDVDNEKSSSVDDEE